MGLLLLGDSARDPDFEIASAFFEPEHFCTDGRRTFDERGVRRTRFARTRGERVDGLPRGCQPSLRFTELLFDDSLLFSEPRHRNFRVRATGLERGSFLFGAPSLHCHEVRLARQAKCVFCGAAELCVVPHKRLLVNVLLFLEHTDRAGGFDDARIEAGDLGRQLRQQLSIASDAFA